ncbi:MAG: MMPL family transporter [Bacteroidales bacterium]|nr:MMPL family transporter [Bacteroidales bacterium]
MIEKIFLSIYHFFDRHTTLMWILLISSTVVFAVFGFQLTYEEDMSKLLPHAKTAVLSDDNADGNVVFDSLKQGIVFENLKVKDKIFVQILSRSGKTSQEELTEICDAFVERLMQSDSATGYYANALYAIDDNLMLNLIDYAVQHVPEFVDEERYATFDSLLTADAIAASMKENARLLAEDETGNAASIVSQDPAGLRYAIREDGQRLVEDLGGYAIINNHFFCPDSSVELVFLSPNVKSFDSKHCIAMVDLLEENIEHFEALYPDVEILFHGAPIQSVFNSRQMKKDLALTLGISLLIIGIVITICFRNKTSLPFLLFPVLYGTFFALACMFWIKGRMSLMALGIGALILGVALSYCLHVLTHYKYVTDPERVIREQARPVCLGCLTTIGAFVGLILTNSDLLRDFGIFASLTLIGTTLSALIFLPHFFKYSRNTRNEKAFKLLDKINTYPIDRKYWLIGLIVVVSVACFVLSGNITFDKNLKNIGYYEPVVMKSRSLYEQKNNPGYFSQYYAIRANTLDSALVYNRDILQKLDSLKDEGQITRYSKITNLFLTEQEQTERIDNWYSYWNTEKIDAVRTRITAAARKNGLNPETFTPFYDMLTELYYPESILDADVLPEELLCNYMEYAEDSSVILFTSVVMPENNVAGVNRIIASNPNAVVVDPFFYTGDMVEILHNDFNTVLLISSLFVLLVLIISLRSFISALIAFSPMFLSWYIVQGVMALFGIPFNLINIIISSFIFGVGVDYSIFIMDGLINKERGQSDSLLIFHKTAIFFSAFTLIVVVCSLLFAQHPAIYSVGVSTMIGMISTILLSYCLQPALFRLACRNKWIRKRIIKSL